MSTMLYVPSVGQQRTVSDLINKAFRIAHVMGQGESLSSVRAGEAFYLLNDIIEQANIQKLFAPYSVDLTIPLTGNKTSYTVGPSTASPVPDVIASRPLEVLSGYTRRGNMDFPVFVTHAKEDYDRIVLKTLSLAGWAYGIFYQTSYPAGTIYVYPVPADGQTELHLNVLAQIAPFTDLRDPIDLPPAYYSWLQYKLAYRICPEYGMPWTPQNQDILDEVTEAVKSQNAKPFPVANLGMGSLGQSGGTGYGYSAYSDSIRGF